MSRKSIPNIQKKRLFDMNGNSCCVCKAVDIGLHLHHIDGNHSNNEDSNIAVLCVKEHDQHHRPLKYSDSNHKELTSQVIRQYKDSWESFINETKQDYPRILAVINAFGTKDNVSTVRIVFQRSDINKIEYQKDFHNVDIPFNEIPDLILFEVNRFGKNIKIALIEEIEPIEHCKNRHGALSKVVNSNYANKIVSPDWKNIALCSVYINPKETSMAISIFYNEKTPIYSASIHKCGHDFHIHDDSGDIKIPFFKKNIRTQLTKIVKDLIYQRWEIDSSRVLFGTGNPDKPEVIDCLHLPKIWES